MILDVFRFKQREIVKVDAVVADHKTSIKKNLPFSIKNLLMHIKNQDHQQMVELLIEFVAKLRSKKALKSVNTCVSFLAEALLTENQNALTMDFEAVIKLILDQISKQSGGDPASQSSQRMGATASQKQDQVMNFQSQPTENSGKDV